MKFTTFAFAAMISVANALPTQLSTRDVYVPPITSPLAGDVWTIGQQYTVTWDVSDPPKQITNKVGRILLRKGERTMPNVVLADKFDILLGKINVSVPEVTPADDYCIVLFGDSGNFSPVFTISSSTVPAHQP